MFGKGSRGGHERERMTAETHGEVKNMRGREASDIAGGSRGAAETVLGGDTEFKGNLTFKESLRIDGKFEGEISSTGDLHVGRNGDIKAELSVGRLVLEGKVHGNVTATDKVEIRSTGQLLGDLKAMSLVVADGVVFVGKCDVNPAAGKIEKLLPEEAVSEEIVAASEESSSSS